MMKARTFLSITLFVVLIVSCTAVFNDRETSVIIKPLNSDEKMAINALRSFVSEVGDITTITPTSIRRKQERIKGMSSGPSYYEITVIRPDGTQGFAIVADSVLHNQVLAYVPVGNITDTSSIAGLSIFFDDLQHYTSISNNQLTKDYDRDRYGNYFTFPRDTVVLLREYGEDEISALGMMWPRLDRVEYDSVGSIIFTKWGQNAPYNNLRTVDQISGERYPAGCGPVALANILAFYRDEMYSTSFWDGLLSSPMVSASDPINAARVAGLMNAMFYYSHAQEKKDSSGVLSTDTSIQNMMSALDSLNYTHYNLPLNNDNLHCPFWAYMCSYPYPMIIGAENSIGTGGRHIWIIDSVLRQTGWYRFLDWSPAIGKYIYYEIPVDGYLLHCNWGWGGNCDGWYAYFRPDSDTYYNMSRTLLFNVHKYHQ